MISMVILFWKEGVGLGNILMMFYVVRIRDKYWNDVLVVLNLYVNLNIN